MIGQDGSSYIKKNGDVLKSLRTPNIIRTDQPNEIVVYIKGTFFLSFAPFASVLNLLIAYFVIIYLQMDIFVLI